MTGWDIVGTVIVEGNVLERSFPVVVDDITDRAEITRRTGHAVNHVTADLVRFCGDARRIRWRTRWFRTHGTTLRGTRVGFSSVTYVGMPRT